MFAQEHSPADHGVHYKDCILKVLNQSNPNSANMFSLVFLHSSSGGGGPERLFQKPWPRL